MAEEGARGDRSRMRIADSLALAAPTAGSTCPAGSLSATPTRQSAIVSDLDLIHVAPPPVLVGLEGLHDRVLGRVEVPRRVMVGRRIAAADVAAGQTKPQVDPPIAGAKTLLAPARRPGLHILLHLHEVRASHRHRPVPLGRNNGSSRLRIAECGLKPSGRFSPVRNPQSGTTPYSNRSPDRTARATASARFDAPSLSNIASRCVLTV
jgi:hypothetical protein